MYKNNDLKRLVQEVYSEIALKEGENSCCSSRSCCSEGSQPIYNLMNEDYSSLKGYDSDADLGLGCGLPTIFAKIQKGDIVIDLGSGAGNDCFIAREEVGMEGKVIGVDFSPEMIDKARANATKKGFKNVKFRKGDIENMPVGGNYADVVVSNCVLNLLPNKNKIFKEIFRILKPGGHFCISDIVLGGELPTVLKEAAEMYAGCVSGAIRKEEYLVYIYSAGFKQVKVEAQKTIILPDSILSKYLNQDELDRYKQDNSGIYSITVTGVKNKCCDYDSS